MNDTLENLRQNVLELRAESAIRALKARYWRAVDRHDLATVSDCLLPGATIDMEGVGVMTGEDFVAFIQRNGSDKNQLNLHTGQNALITLETADSATGRWDALFTSVNMASRETIQMTGDYQDRYSKLQGVWKIAAMTFRQTSFLMQHYNEQGEPRVLALGRGNNTAFGD